MKNQLKPFVALILAITLSGCISVKGNKYQEIKSEDLKISTAKKSKVFIDWDFHSLMQVHSKQNLMDKAKSDHKKIFSKVIADSGCCELVDEKGEADITISGGFYNETSDTGVYFAYLTGFSLFTIPSWVNAKLRVSAEVNKGKITNNYEIKDSVLIAHWLPFILAMPFRENPIKAENNVTQNLYKNLLLKMEKDQLFNK